MRLSIRAKQTAGVTAIVAVVVVILSGMHLTRLSRLGLHESQARGELLASAIFHRVGQIVTDSPDPSVAIQTDPGLLALLQSSIYGESITDAAILDASGVIVAHSDATRVGQRLGPRDDLAALTAAPAWDQLRVIYSSDGGTLEVRQPMELDGEAFGSIRIGASTRLLRQALNAAVRPALVAAAVALGIAVLVAAFLAQLMLRPIHVIRSGLTRLGQGEFGVTLDLPAGDEFGELGSFFNTVSQQLSADRSLMAGQKANLQTAVEHLGDAVALFNPSGELLFANPAMQAVLSPDAVGQALSSVLSGDHPYRRIVEETLTTRASCGPRPASLDPASVRPSSGSSPGGEADAGGGEPRPDGSRLLVTHAIAGLDGQLVGVMLVARNLAYLSRMQSTLAYSRKLVALGRLTAGIAHEVRNPLNAMMIHLELLRTKIRGGSLAGSREPQAVAVGGLGLSAPPTNEADSDVLRHVTLIESEVRRLDEVVQGFLKFTRPEELRLQPVRIASLLEEIVPVIEPDAARHKVAVELSCAGSVPAVNGDATMLRQALMNLAINACQAMQGGGTLRLACSASAHGRVEVRVADTGSGISPEHLSRIFDLYFTTKDHGTGIGLSMVYRIVQLHDGEIDVESTPGRGTTFRLLLPQAEDA